MSNSKRFESPAVFPLQASYNRDIIMWHPSTLAMVDTFFYVRLLLTKVVMGLGPDLRSYQDQCIQNSLYCTRCWSSPVKIRWTATPPGCQQISHSVTKRSFMRIMLATGSNELLSDQSRPCRLTAFPDSMNPFSLSMKPLVLPLPAELPKQLPSSTSVARESISHLESVLMHLVKRFWCVFWSGEAVQTAILLCTLPNVAFKMKVRLLPSFPRINLSWSDLLRDFSGAPSILVRAAEIKDTVRCPTFV